MKRRPAAIALALVAALAVAAMAAACGSGDDNAAAPTSTPRASTPTSPATGSTTLTPPVTSATPAPTSPPDTSVNPSAVPPQSTATITVPADRELEPAPIDQADIITRESSPPQYAVHIVSGIPDGCTQFAGITKAASGVEITITVENSVPRDKTLACTQIYGMHEETVELGSDFTPGLTYTVYVNDKMLTFTAE